MLDHITGYRCVRCEAVYPAPPHDPMTCPACGLDGILDVDYDLARVRETLTRAALATRERSLWRYAELLPVADLSLAPPTLPGMSPLIPAPRLARALGLKALWLKDDGRNPTASFKDRASAIGVLRARELGKAAIACASTGNAATSLAGAAAAVGMACTIFVPERAPAPKIAQLRIFGARVLRVRGSYDEAWRLCQSACERFGWYNRNCAVNPYLVEGKKTCGLEIGEALADTPPDWVVGSVGDGCSIAGIGKGLAEMHALGILPSAPRLLGVQAEGSAAIADAFDAGLDHVAPGGAETFADSIAVSHPRNGQKAVQAVRRSGGAYQRVTDDEIRDAMRVMARQGGVFGEPAASAAYAGLVRARASGLVEAGASAVVCVTGNGLKDTESAIRAAGPPIDVDPTLEAVERALADAETAEA